MLLLIKPFGYNWQLLVIEQLRQSLQHPGLNEKKTKLMPIWGNKKYWKKRITVDKQIGNHENDASK